MIRKEQNNLKTLYFMMGAGSGCGWLGVGREKKNLEKPEEGDFTCKLYCRGREGGGGGLWNRNANDRLQGKRSLLVYSVSGV